MKTYDVTIAQQEEMRRRLTAMGFRVIVGFGVITVFWTRSE